MIDYKKLFAKDVSMPVTVFVIGLAAFILYLLVG